MDGVRFELRYDRWCGWLLGLLGLGRRRSHVTVAADDVRVVMGWAFAATIARASISSIVPTDRRVWAWGVHGWRGRWLVNGSSHGLVTLTIEPPARSSVLGLRGRLRELTVSLDDRDTFVRALA